MSCISHPGRWHAIALSNALGCFLPVVVDDHAASLYLSTVVSIIRQGRSEIGVLDVEE